MGTILDNEWDQRQDGAMTTTITISCGCRTCKTNADQLGLPLPLRAEVPSRLMPTTGSDAKLRGLRHGFVAMAHDPNPITGAAARSATGVKPL